MQYAPRPVGLVTHFPPKLFSIFLLSAADALPAWSWVDCASFAFQPPSSLWPAMKSAVENNYKLHSMSVLSSNHRGVCSPRQISIRTEQHLFQMLEQGH